MCQLFIDDILKTFKKETNQLWVLIILTSTHSTNLIAWYREYDARLTVSGNDPIGRDASNLKNRRIFHALKIYLSRYGPYCQYRTPGSHAWNRTGDDYHKITTLFVKFHDEIGKIMILT